MTRSPRPNAALRRLVASTLATAFLATLFAPTGALAQEIDDDFTLAVAQNSRRHPAEVLDGATVRADASVAAFLSLDSLGLIHEIRRVKFSVNGSFLRSEYRYPYDLAGTRSRRRARLVPAYFFHTGPNEIGAEVVLRDKSSVTVSGILNVLPRGDNIVQAAAKNPDFSILVEAVIAAGLADDLSGPGPLTVFAPNNEAFLALLEDLGKTKEELFDDKDLLRQVLLYHVLGEGVFSPQVLASPELIPLQGEPITVDAENGKVNDSNLIAIDLATSNGVIHVIDAVLLPPTLTAAPLDTLAQIVAGNPDFSILLEAVQEVGLDGVLSVASTEFTVFAPTNQAFLDLLGALGISKEELFANRAVLTTVLLYHIVNEELFSTDVLAEETILTLGSESLTVDAEAGTVDDANLIALDFDASNGVAHVIDAVLIPKAALELLAP